MDQDADQDTDQDTRREKANRVAIVTGGGRGLGRAVARRLGREGARVVIADRDAETGARAAAEIAGALFVQTDVTDPASVAAMVRQAIDRFGQIDILINNAAITGNQPEYQQRALLDTPLDFWRRILDVNVTSVFVVTQAVAQRMAERRSGVIVNISSIAGLFATPGDFAYSVSKHAVNMLTYCAAGELAAHGIRVNAIAPGGMYRPESGRPRPSGNVGNLLGRVAEFEDVADAVALLCSEDARFIDGQVISVDGGASTGSRYVMRRMRNA